MAVRRFLLRIALALGLIPIFLAAVTYWALHSEAAARWLVVQLPAWTQGQVELQDVRGEFANGLLVGHLMVKTSAAVVSGQDIKANWSLSGLLHRQFTLQTLAAQSLDIQLLDTTEPQSEAEVPNSLQVPIDITLLALDIAELRVHQNQQSYPFHGVHGKLATTPEQHTLSVSAVDSIVGPIKGEASIATARPFAIKGQIAAPATPGPKPIAVNSTLTGTLLGLHIAVDGTAAQATAHADLLLAPFAHKLLRNVTATLQHLDVQNWSDTQFQSDLSAKLQLTSHSGNDLQGSLEIDNESSGTSEQRQLPFKALRTGIDGDMGHVRLNDILLDLATAGRLLGSGTVNTDVINLDLHTDALNLKGLSEHLIETRLRGPLHLQAGKERQNVEVNLRQADKQIDLDIQREHSTLALRTARVAAAGGLAVLHGTMKLEGDQPFHVNGTANHLDLAKLGDYPETRLNSMLDVRGHIKPKPEGSLSLDLNESLFRRRPLSGYANVTLDAHDIVHIDSNLNLAGNKLTAQGLWGQEDTALAWAVDAPAIDALINDVHGSVNGHGRLQGTYRQPAGSLQFLAQNLRLPQGLQTQSIQGTVDLAPGTDGALNASLDLIGLTRSEFNLNSAQLRLNGRRTTQNFTLVAKSAAMDLSVTGNGKYADQRWDGSITSLTNAGPYPLRLIAPAELGVAAETLRLTHAAFDTELGHIDLQSIVKSPKGLELRGNIKDFSLQQLATYSNQPQLKSSDLKLEAKWDLHGKDSLSGELQINRQSGDVIITHDTHRQPLLLRELSATMIARSNAIRANALVTGEQIGSLSLEGTGTLVPRHIANSPLQLDLQLAMPNLAWVSAFDERIETDGQLNATLKAHGCLSKPDLEGQLNGNNISVRYPAEGIELKDGVVAMQLAQQQIVVSRLSANGETGTFQAEGTLTLDEQPSLLNYRFTNFLAVSRPDRDITLSGTGTVATNNDRLVLNGDLKVDKGHIGLGEANEVSLSKDIVIVDDAKASTGEEPASPPTMPIAMQLGLDLGDALKVDGRGVQANLTGKLNVRAVSGKLPRAFGTVYVKKGTVRQYGQELTIENGAVNFDGAIDNPGLNIIARRKQSEDIWAIDKTVDVHVQMSGTALKPRVELVSTPEMPDSEKLAWLILGHGLQGSQNSEMDVLRAVATSLLSSDNSDSMQTKLATAIGVENIGMRRDTTQQQTFATLGKRISARAYLTLEQALGGAASLAKLRYQLTKRWSLQATAGTESALDLFYNWRFD